MKTPMLRIPAFLALVTVLFFILSFSIDWVKERLDTAPIIIHSAQAETSTLAPGEPLRLVLTITRNRVCHTQIARYVHSSNGDVIAYQEAIGGDAPIGTTRYAFQFRLPPDIRPGRYSFKGVVASACGERRYIETTPAIAFSVDGRT